MALKDLDSLHTQTLMEILTVLCFQNCRAVFATLYFASSAGYSEKIFYELHNMDTMVAHWYKLDIVLSPYYQMWKINS